MAKTDILDILKSRRSSPLEFDYDRLWIPPINFYLTPQDIEELRKIATSLRLSSKIREKYKLIDNIMRNRGFKRFSAGTNRVVYSFTEDDRFVVKIAVDKVGMQDNPLEFKNQFILKPYVAKMFYISPCGTVGFAERVLPIKNKEEFREIADDVFYILVNKILGLYVVGDVGTKYFMNWGVRKGVSPVLLDYPYCYKLDGNKLYCTEPDPLTGMMCNGEIDYDAGFNKLICTRCGTEYLPTDLRDNSSENKIIIKGGTKMKIVLKEGNKIVGQTINTEEYIRRPVNKRPEFKKGGLVARPNDHKLVDAPNNDIETSEAKSENQPNSQTNDKKSEPTPKVENADNKESDQDKPKTVDVQMFDSEDYAADDDKVSDSDNDKITYDDIDDASVQSKFIPPAQTPKSNATPNASLTRDEKGRFTSSGKPTNKQRNRSKKGKSNTTVIPSNK